MGPREIYLLSLKDAILSRPLFPNSYIALALWEMQNKLIFKNLSLPPTLLSRKQSSTYILIYQIVKLRCSCLASLRLTSVKFSFGDGGMGFSCCSYRDGTEKCTTSNKKFYHAVWRPRSANRQGEKGTTAFFQAVIPWQPQAGSQPLLWSCFLSLALICQELFESAQPSYWHKTKFRLAFCSLSELKWLIQGERTEWKEQRPVFILGFCHFVGWWSHPKQAQTERGDTGWEQPMAQHTGHNAPQHCCSSDMLWLQISYVILFSLKQEKNPKMFRFKNYSSSPWIRIWSSNLMLIAQLNRFLNNM